MLEKLINQERDPLQPYLLFFLLSALGRIIFAFCAPKSTEFATQYTAFCIFWWDIFYFLGNSDAPWTFALVGESVHREMRKKDKVLSPLSIF
jgi:hypothetical protein